MIDTTHSPPLSRSDLMVAVLLVAAVFLVHASALTGWWLYDDPQLLLHARDYRAWDILFSPEAYRFLASHTFTPLLSLSFKFDLSLAGVNPKFCYLHQLSALALSAVLLFLLLRRNVTTAVAGIASAGFVVAAPTVVIAQTLMMRHYLEGLVLALVALLLWSRKVHSWPGDLAAALFYLLAMIAKEVYAPLPLLMIAAAYCQGQRGGRIASRLIPIFLAALTFIVWRGLMLGSAGGYGDLPSASAVLRLPAHLFAQSFEGSPPMVLWGSALLLAALVVPHLLRAERCTIFVALASVVFAFLPIVPLASRLEPRYAFVAFVTLVAVSALAAGGSPLRMEIASAFLVAFVLLAGVAGWFQIRQVRLVTAAMKAEGRYVWREEATAPALLAGSPGWYLEGLKRLRGTGPRFILGKEPLILGEVDPRNLVMSRWGSDELVPQSASDLAGIVSERSRLKVSIPMQLQFRREKHALWWNVAPASGGSWTFLTYPYYGRYPIPSQGRNRIPDSKERQYFRVRRDLPDGSWNLSPVIELPTEGKAIRWSGPGPS